MELSNFRTIDEVIAEVEARKAAVPEGYPPQWWRMGWVTNSEDIRKQFDGNDRQFMQIYAEVPVPEGYKFPPCTFCINSKITECTPCTERAVKMGWHIETFSVQRKPIDV